MTTMTALGTTLRISRDGLLFLARHEGFVMRAYLCPAGVVTIAYGFTNSSKIFRQYWLQKYGRKLRLGDTITRDEADVILVRMVNEEYGGAVLAKAIRKDLLQHEVDACSSVSFNLGPRAYTWRWGQELKLGNLGRASELLRVTGTTARGKKLAGLVRRREDEARLLEFGIYEEGSKYYQPVSQPEGVQRDAVKTPRFDSVVKEAQELLKARGFDPGKIDGWMGTNTKAAVLAYQKTHPHLTNDGIIGPATLAQLRRDAAAVRETLTGGGGVGGLGLISALAGFPWEIIIPAAIICGGLYLAYTHRYSILRKWNQFRGKVVE